MRGKWLDLVYDHECTKPSVRRKGVGSRWQCRCGQEWELTEKRYSGGFLTTRWVRRQGV